ncbi:amidohydrolase family protein [Actinocorallia populi]|uniref:amidohydrolase family protein n=1 Tax=Actinocorallia populi TaxID=2079200 RepID=UPI000D092A74|nr:amidohydrolase family protein [Actinocorallia populi]
MSTLLLRGVEVAGRPADVRLAGGVVAELGSDLAARPGDEVLDGRGGALIPGLHDHHIHLMATAAAERSVRVGPPEVSSPGELADVLRRADAALPPGAWLRAVGYHESVAGDLDREALDALLPHRPVRVQHRSGAQWSLNSAACRAVGLDEGQRPEGAETDASGRPTGRLLRADAWLRDRLPAGDPPDLSALGRRLARAGVTGVTDATPVERPADLRVLADAGLPQRLTLTGGPALAAADFPENVARGPVKLVVADHELPSLDALAGAIGAAHLADRPVAVHCVSLVALVLALAAWEQAGVRSGDRIEHASVVSPELVPVLAARGLTVVTQPGFVAERGDRYLLDVPPREHADLYRCASLLDAGVPVAGSTDAPYGSPDPWIAVKAAADRRTAGGRILGARERLSPHRALELFLTAPDAPGKRPRSVRPGAPADLVLLAAPLGDVLAAPSSDAVVMTFFAGTPFSA